MKALDKYPWPMSTKQIVKLIQDQEIPYDNLKVKLVDIFEFKPNFIKLKNPSEYIDFKIVIKQKWVRNVTYSKIYIILNLIKKKMMVKVIEKKIKNK